ncbi:FemAB family XrtA/PEP-CTERM system-associated protein [Bowmanella yangjiangensis]|nr:FemAB family XrtA/PEP-CTERM system-associated protein [Bowmanella yangjiangensis]
MMEFSQLKKEQLGEWQAYVDQHPDATPYHHVGWGQAITSAYKHTSYYFAAKQDGQIVGILPVVAIKPPLKSTQYCSLPFCDVGGPLANDNKTAQQLIDFAAESLCAEQPELFSLRLAGKPVPEEELSAQAKVRMLLTLPGDAETLMASFKSKLRSQIRKAEKNGLTCQLGRNDTLLNDFYQVFVANMRDLGSPVHGFSLFEQLEKCYGDSILMSVVYSENKPVGGGIVLMTKDRASIPWASTIQEYNRLAPNMMLYWSLLARIADSGRKEFDFGRSTPNEGTYKFKAQWGATPHALEWFAYKQLQEDKLSTSSSARLLAEKTWRHMPLGVTKAIGPMLRRYINL